jgi:hypothetical protein
MYWKSFEFGFGFGLEKLILSVPSERAALK